MRTDLEHLQFLTCAGASMVASVSQSSQDGHELLLRAPRAGVLSLSNILLWLHANNWRREILTLNDLPFCEPCELEIFLRITDTALPGNYGTLRYDANSRIIEWLLCDDALQRAGLTLHRLACRPEHAYDIFDLPETSDLKMRVCMTDGSDWS